MNRDDAPQATVSCRNLWKIYGPKADRIVGTPDADLPRGELLEKTGCVAATTVPVGVWMR